MSEEFHFFDNYEDYIMNYLTQIESKSEDVFDMLSHKKNKISFWSFNQYLAQIGKPLKLIRHTITADDNYALTVIQEENSSIFIERLLERSLQTTDDEQTFLTEGVPQKNAIVNDSIKNITLCKNAYKNLCNAVADCLRQSFNYIDKEHLKKIDKDLRLSHFFIDFDYKHNAQDLLRAYAHFFNKLGRFPGSLEFATVPQCDTPLTLLTSYHPLIFMIDLEHQTQEN